MGIPHGNVQGIAATRFPSHQLSNGLYVSGHPDQYKEKGPKMSVSQMPYTGGDVKKSGELGKMFDIPVESSNSGKPRMPGGMGKGSSCGSFTSRSGPLLSDGVSYTPVISHDYPVAGASSKHTMKPGFQTSKSGPLIGSMAVATRKTSNSGPLVSSVLADQVGSANSKAVQGGAGSKSSVLRNASPLAVALPTTGLITSGPISGPISLVGDCKKDVAGTLDSSGMPGTSLNTGGAGSSPINNLSHDQEFTLGKKFPRVVLWTVLPLFVMGFIAGGFIIAAVHNAILLIVVSALFFSLVALFFWNSCRGRSSVSRFLAKYPDSELGSAKDGQYVKITGVVTCGSLPLESSYEKISRCIYTSTGLYEFRSLFSKPASKNHRWFTWGTRFIERHVVDFYISDFQSGLRALVKAGYSARTTPYVQDSAVVEVGAKRGEIPSDLRRWLTERKISVDDRVMKLREGYIKEGSVVTVLGVIQRHENVLMIVPPSEAVSTGCQLTRLLLPTNLEGIIITSEHASRNEGIPL